MIHLVRMFAGMAILSAAITSATAADQHPLRVGADQLGGNAFAGEIAAVRIHDRALTDAEIKALAAQQPAAPPAIKPTWQWRPDPAFAANLTCSGKAHATTVADIPCVRFDGGFMQAAPATVKLGPEFTVECWIRPAREGVTCRLVDQITPGGTDGFLLDLFGDKLRFILGDQTFTREWDEEPGRWVHVAAVGKGNQVVLRINGRNETGGDLTFAGESAAPPEPLTLWWRRPGSGWTEAMVLGNGRLGAMVAGGVSRETLWLNEDTLWSGEPTVPSNPAALKALPEVRRLLIARQEQAAHNLYNQKMLGPYNECYMPLGTLNLRFPITGEVRDYRRDLDLRSGIAKVRFAKDGVTHSRETFASFPDQTLVTRLAADRPGQVTFSASLASLVRHEVKAEGKVLRLTGRCPVHADPHYLGNRVTYDEGPNPKGMRFAVELRAVAEGGKLTVTDDRIVAEGCDAVTLVLVAATSFNGFDKSPSRDGRDPVARCQAEGEVAARTQYATLRQRHVADFNPLMDRVSLDLGQTAASSRPTAERIGAGFKPEDLPTLAALYYQFGRYLLVSASRPGSQPANLQGIWNRALNPPWSANWTMNCNANFNYLGIEAANLSELHEPFIRLIREWSVDGARTARNWYGCAGWVGHHNCDLWRNACPVGGDCSWAAFPCGSAWACQSLWEHYAFTLDKTYLTDIWPVLRGNAEFFLEFLFEEPQTHYLVVGPDVNFENAFAKPNGPGAALCLGTTPSNMQVRQLFLNCIAASKILGRDDALRTRLEQAVRRLPPTVVNPRNGEIQEYLDPDYAIANRGACELLSAWGLIWCDQITPRQTPELAAALRKAYEAPDRRPWATGQVGSWQGAFPANTFARLGDGNRVTEILQAHFQHIVQPNLTAGFIQSEWEIDGNLGQMAAIGEMLMQSHTGEIELLPALPQAWRNGAVKGLKARGNVTVDITWQDGKVADYQLHSPIARPVQLRVNGSLKTVTPSPP